MRFLIRSGYKLPVTAFCTFFIFSLSRSVSVYWGRTGAKLTDWGKSKEAVKSLISLFPTHQKTPAPQVVFSIEKIWIGNKDDQNLYSFFAWCGVDFTLDNIDSKFHDIVSSLLRGIAF